MNYSVHSFELSRVLEKKEFKEQLKYVKKYKHKLYETNFGYVDESRMSDGVGIEYHDKRKKKIKFIVNPSILMDTSKLWKPKYDVSKLNEELYILINGYFNSDCELNDMKLTRMDFTVDIDVGKASDYIKILHNIGRVKGFSQIKHGRECKEYVFNLVGADDVEFIAYCREAIPEGSKPESIGDKLLLKPRTGILRLEVRLSNRVIREYTDETDTSRQIRDLSVDSKEVFMDTFQRIVPRGDHYKKKVAEGIVTDGVSDKIMRKKMIKLLELIPEKKSLLLAQKILNIRNTKSVMKEFENIDLSPVTLSKRHNGKKLDSLYSFLD